MPLLLIPTQAYSMLLRSMLQMPPLGGTVDGVELKGGDVTGMNRAQLGTSKPVLASAFQNCLHQYFHTYIRNNLWKKDTYKSHLQKNIHLTSLILWILWILCLNVFNYKKDCYFLWLKIAVLSLSAHHFLFTSLHCNFLFICLCIPQDWISWIPWIQYWHTQVGAKVLSEWITE